MSFHSEIKIAFIIDFIFATTGGTENQVIKIIKNIDKKRFKAQLIVLKNTTWLKQNKLNFECPVFTFNYDIYHHANPKNVLVFLRLIRLLKELRPHIVICFFKVSYIVGVLCAFWAGVRHIISTRRDYGLWLDGRSVIFLRMANRYVNNIVTNSEKVKRLTGEREKYPFQKIKIIYNGIEFSNDLRKNEKINENRMDLREILGISPDQKLIGIVAGLRPMKKHETFLKAAKIVLEKRKDVHFLIVGDGPRRQELENLVKDLHISSNVHFLGWKENVSDVLLNFDIGVNCSANEGLSNAIMEYMAHGVPCVVSDAGGNPELIKNGVNGFLFKLGDWRQLAEKIQILLDNSELRQQFTERSINIILNEFSVKKMISCYENYFEEIVNS